MLIYIYILADTPITQELKTITDCISLYMMELSGKRMLTRGLTRYLASYWAHQGVRCNALSPGGVFNGQSDEFVGRLTNLIPMGRMATEDEYRGAIQFLCSDASLYLNGQNIVIDGGRSVL